MSGDDESPFPAWAVMRPARVRHVQRVAVMLNRWADRMELRSRERERWLHACYLHDALRDADLGDSFEHGPRAAERAVADGVTDRSVLDAVRFHTVGSADWDLVGRTLYCADFLEPGRRFDRRRRARLADRYPDDPDGVLREVVRLRMVNALQQGWPLRRETVALWNRLCESSD